LCAHIAAGMSCCAQVKAPAATKQTLKMPAINTGRDEEGKGARFAHSVRISRIDLRNTSENADIIEPIGNLIGPLCRDGII
jgi:hypothetical protein